MPRSARTTPRRLPARLPLAAAIYLAFGSLAWAQDAQGPDLQIPEPETLGLLAAAAVAALVVRRIARK